MCSDFFVGDRIFFVSSSLLTVNLNRILAGFGIVLDKGYTLERKGIHLMERAYTWHKGCTLDRAITC